MVSPVTDPDILAQLNSSDTAAPKPVSDPKILKQLNGDVEDQSESHPFSDALRGLGSLKSFQPFDSLEDAVPYPKSHTGNPVSDILDSMKTIAEFPTRVSSTMGAFSDPVSNATAEGIGKLSSKLQTAGLPGIHPAVGAALAMAAGMAVDPRSYMTMGLETPSGADLGKIGGMGPEAAARATQAEKYGVTLTPAEAAQTKIPKVLEDLGNIYPYTGDQFANFYKTQLLQSDNIRSALLDSVGTNKATETVGNLMKKQITDYLSKASPEDAAVLQDKFGDLDAYMKKPAAGQFTQSMLAQSRKIALDAAGAQFDALDNIVPKDTPIETPTFKAQAQKFLEQEMQSNKTDRNPSWVKRLSDYAGVNTNAVPTMADGTPIAGPLYDAIKKALGEEGKPQQEPVSFAGTQATMRKLRDERISNDPGYLRGIPGQGNTYAGYAAKLRGALSDDIHNGLSDISDKAKETLKNNPPAGTNPDGSTWGDLAAHDKLQQTAFASEKYDAAKTNYAKTKDLMNDHFIKNLLNNDPEDFLTHAIEPQDVTNVSKLKTILGPDNFVPVQQNLLANMLVDKTGNLNPTAFVKNVDKIGMPTLSKVFDPSTLAEIVNSQQIFRNMTHIGTAVNAAVGEGSQTAGRMMAKTAMFGVPVQAYHLLMNGEPGSAAGLVAGAVGIPKALARMYLSDTGRDLLIHGASVPDSAAATLSLIGKTAAMSGSEAVTSSANKQQ